MAGIQPNPLPNLPKEIHYMILENYVNMSSRQDALIPRLVSRHFEEETTRLICHRIQGEATVIFTENRQPERDVFGRQIGRSIVVPTWARASKELKKRFLKTFYERISLQKSYFKTFMDDMLDLVAPDRREELLPGSSTLSLMVRDLHARWGQETIYQTLHALLADYALRHEDITELKFELAHIWGAPVLGSTKFGINLLEVALSLGKINMARSMVPLVRTELFEQLYNGNLWRTAHEQAVFNGDHDALAVMIVFAGATTQQNATLVVRSAFNWATMGMVLELSDTTAQWLLENYSAHLDAGDMYHALWQAVKNRKALLVHMLLCSDAFDPSFHPEGPAPPRRDHLSNLMTVDPELQGWAGQRTNILKHFLYRGVHSGIDTALFKAIEQDDTEAFELMLDYNQAISDGSQANDWTIEGRLTKDLLVAAIYFGHSKLVEMLLARGVDRRFGHPRKRFMVESIAPNTVSYLDFLFLLDRTIPEEIPGCKAVPSALEWRLSSLSTTQRMTGIQDKYGLLSGVDVLVCRTVRVSYTIHELM
ncbi:uncharacterized protein DSM5745_07907 [Aspergillus mulundensis]|uniref:Uncharacterized protein n=1 Tax=Aspergillus mulundensis TaxID=1810919 RepID=A0A3D8RFB3_9EURO|nr:hypothetical protein DSM5745_07907 [Aspergillus mulundensis]RDW72735.1 hypothetical protein DSM5745_07907 [Aspergillus mulundensis]